MYGPDTRAGPAVPGTTTFYAADGNQDRAQGREMSEHAVQLFDNAESLAETVLAFAAEGWSSNSTVLLLLSQDSRRALGVGLRRRDAEEAIADGRLTVRDAATVLTGFVSRGVIQPVQFERTIAAAVYELAGRGRPLRVYGEMVDLMAAQGDYRSALQLEHLWNDLSRRIPFTLLCGYSSNSFGDPRVAADLHRICRAHSHVRRSDRDPLGTFLLESAPRRIPPIVPH
jgi:hypothetical protein